MNWLIENWTWLAALAGLYLLWDIASSLRAVLAELRRPGDELSALRITHGIDRAGSAG